MRTFYLFQYWSRGLVYSLIPLVSIHRSSNSCSCGTPCQFGYRYLFVGFEALRPKSTAMVMADGQFTLPHFFLGKLEQAVSKYFVHILSLVNDNNPS